MDDELVVHAWSWTAAGEFEEVGRSSFLLDYRSGTTPLGSRAAAASLRASRRKLSVNALSAHLCKWLHFHSMHIDDCIPWRTPLNEIGAIAASTTD
jgi:hypothetical protein